MCKRFMLTFFPMLKIDHVRVEKMLHFTYLTQPEIFNAHAP
jgi:hypothetical protein